MNNFLLAVTVVGAAYFLWFLFVLALVSSLNELKKSTRHYKIYNYIIDERYPKNSCDYGKILTLAPAIFAGIGTALMLWSLFVILRFFFNWLIWPFITGRAPADGLSKNYFNDLITINSLPEDIGQRGIPTKRFMKLSPFLWMVVLGFISAASFETYRVITGSATKLENNIFLITSAVCVAILIMTWIVKRPSLKIMYAIAKEKLCRNIPVVG